jgi:hypothetical protein
MVAHSCSLLLHNYEHLWLIFRAKPEKLTTFPFLRVKRAFFLKKTLETVLKPIMAYNTPLFPLEKTNF